MRSRILKGVLDHFLGTYTSRYSEYQGYWVFGQMLDQLESLQIDLLSRDKTEPESGPTNAAGQIAVQRFQEQAAKAALSISRIQTAWLQIEKLPALVDGFVGDRICSGCNVRFVATAILKSGKKFERETTIFVAPHDRRIERQSNRFS